MTTWLKCLKNNIWRLPAKNRVPLPSSCCLELWGLFTSDFEVSPFCCCFAGMRVLWYTLTWWTCSVGSWIVLSGETRYLFTSVCYMGGTGFCHQCCLVRFGEQNWVTILALYKSGYYHSLSYNLWKNLHECWVELFVPMFLGSSLLSVVRNAGVRTFALDFVHCMVYCAIDVLFLVLTFTVADPDNSSYVLHVWVTVPI